MHIKTKVLSIVIPSVIATVVLYIVFVPPPECNCIPASPQECNCTCIASKSEVDSKYPSTLQSDRMEIDAATYGSRSITDLLKRIYDSRGTRRMRITQLYALDYLFGQPSGDMLSVRITPREKKMSSNMPFTLF